MAPSSRRRRGTFGAFRRPFLTDPVFWIAGLIAVGVGALISAALVALGGSVPDSGLAWGVAVLIFAIAGWTSFKLLAMGLNTSRALRETEVADDERAASLERKGRSAGAVLGKGAARLMGRRPTEAEEPSTGAPATPATSPPAAPATPTPTGSGAEAEPEVTVDKAARVLGSMVGRRLGERRKTSGS